MNDDIIDYTAQEAPFRKWEQIKQKISAVANKQDTPPADWLDELEREREDGRVWQLTQKAK